jgi:hypothetical protein
MGDRTYCNLNLKGEIPAEKLAPIIADILADTATDSGPEDGWWGFEEVNYGDPERVHPNLESQLQAAGISYEWSWDSGDEYGAGFHLYDAETQTSWRYIYTVDDEIAFTFSDLENTTLMDSMRHAESVRKREFVLIGTLEEEKEEEEEELVLIQTLHDISPEAQAICERQGWNDQCLISVLLNYIKLNQIEGALGDFFREVADEENASNAP